MTERAVRVTAPSRLHFGMLALGPAHPRCFGGVGAMIASPGLQLVIRPAERLQTAGVLSRRTKRAGLRAAKATRRRGDDAPRLGCRIEVTRAPRHHVGLGTGTQLAMAVAAGLNAFWGGPPLEPAELARRVGRGQRSAVGLYGFTLGGLLFEGGKEPGEEVSPLIARVELPPTWRFVLVCPREGMGLFGRAERRAFAELPPVAPQHAQRLRRLAEEQLLPAAAAGRFDDFSQALYDFGYQAGISFASQQGGPFAGPRLAALVDTIRKLGVRGVGQSSWGPTLFALLPDEASAADFLDGFRRETEGDDLELTVTAADSRGARIDVRELPRRAAEWAGRTE